MFYPPPGSEGTMSELLDDDDRKLALYETVFESIHDAVYTLDMDGIITWVNQSAVEEFEIGYTREELIGANVAMVLDEADIEAALSIIQTLLEDDDEQSGQCEVAIQTAHGTEIPCELEISLLPFDEDGFRGTVGVLREITGRKQREQRLAVLNRVLRHNTRNEMALISGEAENLRQRLDGSAAAAAARIRDRAQAFGELAEKARRIEESLEAEDQLLAEVDVVTMVRDSLSRFRDTYPDATFELSAPREQRALATESLRIAVDELLENAVEHNPGDAVVSITVADRGSQVTIDVEDNGEPIPEAEIDVIQSGDETQLRHGSGLGLWCANWVVQRAAGGLDFERPADGGNRVTITLQPPSDGE